MTAFASFLSRFRRALAVPLLVLACASAAWAQAPAITTQPANKTVTAPTTATFTVAATGAAPLSYQWMKDGVTIAGATAASYTTPATSSLDTGAVFTVTISNAQGSVTSAGSWGSSGVLTVNGPPVLTTQPSNQSAAVGATATFRALAKGSGLNALSYVWKRNGVSVGYGITSGGFNTKTTPAVTLADDGAQYTVTVTTSYGSVTSSAATLTVTTAPSNLAITPASQTVYAGQPASFAASASGSAPFTYQWNKAGTPIPGATLATLGFSPAALGDAGNYTVTVTNAVGFATSSAATLTVNPAVAPSFPPAVPADRSVVANTTATFTAVASGGPAPTYQWYRGLSPISGATGSSYSFTAQTTDDGATFKVVATNLQGSATSRVATLTVTPAVIPPAITTQPPATQTVERGAPATFTVAASGSDPKDYQWTKGGQDIPGATAVTYTIPATASADAGTYAVRVHNAGGTATSQNSVLTVAVYPPQITTQPASQTVLQGAQATFTVAASGTPPFTYQWFKNSSATPIAGAVSASYQTPATTLADNGNTYYAQVSNDAGGANSAQAVLTVTQPVLGAMTWKRDIVYMGTKEVAEISAQGVSVTLTDHLGSPRFVVDPTGAVIEQKFMPFGESLIAQADQARVAKGFTNHEQTDPSGLIYMQARFYGPMYHRFLSPDPARDQHFEETQSWNIYNYVQNNPILSLDPTGMFGEDPLTRFLRAVGILAPAPVAKTADTLQKGVDGVDKANKLRQEAKPTTRVDPVTGDVVEVEAEENQAIRNHDLVGLAKDTGSDMAKDIKEIEIAVIQGNIKVEGKRAKDGSDMAKPGTVLDKKSQGGRAAGTVDAAKRQKSGEAPGDVKLSKKEAERISQETQRALKEAAERAKAKAKQQTEQRTE